MSPRDPIAFFLALVLLGGTSILATLPPAARAGRVDPLAVLRLE